MTAVWFRADNVGPDYFASPVYQDLWRVARERMAEIKVSRSNITRGWTYNADIYLVKPTGTFHADAPHIERNRYVPNGAGSGKNPVLAMIDALRILRFHHDPIVACAILQAELWLLQRAVADARAREEREARVMAKLDATLDGLTDLVRSYTVPADDDWHGDIPLGQARPMPAKPDEDDDL